MRTFSTGPLVSPTVRGYVLVLPAIVGLGGCLLGLSVAIQSVPTDRADVGFWILLVGFFALVIGLPPALRFRRLERRAARATSDESAPWLFANVAWTMVASPSDATPQIRRGDAGWLSVRDGRLEFWVDGREAGPVLAIEGGSLVDAAPVWGGGLVFAPVVRFAFETDGQIEIVDSSLVHAGWRSLLGVRDRDLRPLYRLQKSDRA